MALVFKKKLNGIEVVVRSPPAQETYITASFAPKSSKFGVKHSISVSEMNSALTSLEILADTVSTGTLPTVKITLMSLSLNPCP